MRYRREWRCLTVFVCSVAVAAFAIALSPSSAEEPWTESDAERRQRLLAMDAAEKERLERQAERFDDLTPEEKQKLRQIHEELSTAPDGEKLYAVLQRYCEWLKTLNAAERAELSTLPETERIAKIRQLMKQQEEQRFRKLANLSYEDTKVVLDWLDQLVQPHEEELLALLSKESKDFLSKFGDAKARRRWIVWSLFAEEKRDQLRDTIEPSPGDVERLLADLSEKTQEDFKRLGDPQKEQETVRKWIFWAVFPRPSYRPVSDSELHKFFATLPTEQQAELERLPRDEMHHELRKLYYASHFRGPDGRPGEGGPHIRPPFRGPFREGPGGRFDRPRQDEKTPFAKPPGT